MYLRYIKNSYNSIIKRNSPTKKLAKDLNRYFDKEIMSVVSKHENILNIVSFQESQNYSEYYFTPTRMAIMRKIISVVENVKWYNCFGKQSGNSSKG